MDNSDNSDNSDNESKREYNDWIEYYMDKPEWIVKRDKISVGDTSTDVVGTAIAMPPKKKPEEEPVKDITKGVAGLNFVVNVGAKKGAKKGGKKGGRKKGTPNSIMRFEPMYAVIDKESGTAVVYDEPDEKRIELAVWGHKSAPRFPELFVVVFASGQHVLFRNFANVHEISLKLKLGKIKTVYSARMYNAEEEEDEEEEDEEGENDEAVVEDEAANV
eukprot:g51846.t1